MPRYELLMIMRNLDRPLIFNAIKRTSEELFSKGAIIRSMENMGPRRLPYKMGGHGQQFKEGSYFLINFDSPPDVPKYMEDHLARDVDIIRPRIARKDELVGKPCEEGPCEFGELNDNIRDKLSKDLNRFVKKL